MPTEVSPKQFQESVEQGFKRLRNFREARLMFIRAYTGQYYDATHGDVGTEPLNLIFNAIRILVPNIVMNVPKHTVRSKYVAYGQYAELLELALTQQDRVLSITDTYRRWIVDAIFTLGIVKTGLCASESALHFEDDGLVDPGTIYTETVDFDNFVFDPKCRDSNFRDARFIGERLCVPRLSLLDSGLYRNDLIERLPAAYTDYGYDYEGGTGNTAAELSMRSINRQDNKYDDDVEIVEAWVPAANALVTVPRGGLSTDEFLRVADYVGPETGPYTFLKFTPPAPNNPLPVSMVGVWYDLHVTANKLAHKFMRQADRQKDIIGYKRSAADDAQEALDAADGEAVAMDDPEGVKVHSFGGANQTNDVSLERLQMWFNMMAANPQGVGGVSMNAKSATEANILQGNASVTLEDMKDLVYNAANAESRNRAWFLQTDPLINIPLIRRQRMPAQYAPGPTGPIMVQPPQSVEQQVFLTPEARRGEHSDYVFSIVSESMGRMDSRTRYAKAMEFAIKAVPAAASAAQTSAMMGVMFSFPRFLTHLAKEAGIEWMDEVFDDPEFQMQMMVQAMQIPRPAKGQVGQSGGMAGVMQNGQPANIAAFSGDKDQGMVDQQQGSAAAQGDLPIRSAY